MLAIPLSIASRVFGRTISRLGWRGTPEHTMGDEPSSETTQRATAIMNVLALSPSNGVAYLQAGAGLERMSQLRQSVDVLRTAVRLLPQHATAYDRLGVVLYKAAMRVEWSLFRDQPGLQPPPDRIPGDEHPCWRAAEPNCFELEHYGPQQLLLAEADFLRRVEKSKGDTRAVLLLGRALRNCSVTASVQSLRLDPRKATPYLTLAHVLPVGGSPALYRLALQLDPKQADVYLWHGDALHRLRYFKQASHLLSTAWHLHHASGPPSTQHNVSIHAYCDRACGGMRGASGRCTARSMHMACICTTRPTPPTVRPSRFVLRACAPTWPSRRCASLWHRPDQGWG